MPRQTREEAVAFAQKLIALQTKDLQFQVSQGLQELDRRNCETVGKVTQAEKKDQPDRPQGDKEQPVQQYLGQKSVHPLAFIDRCGEPGTKRHPGETYGIIRDEWSDLPVTVISADQHVESKP